MAPAVGGADAPAMPERTAQRLDAGGVEPRPRAAEAPAVPLLRSPAPMRAARSHGLERVGDQDDPRLEWDVPAGEALRVASAVDTLVMVQHETRLVGELSRGDDVVPDLRVGAHHPCPVLVPGSCRIGTAIPILPTSWRSLATRSFASRTPPSPSSPPMRTQGSETVSQWLRALRPRRRP